jgi:hypothetical protein
VVLDDLVMDPLGVIVVVAPLASVVVVPTAAVVAGGVITGVATLVLLTVLLLVVYVPLSVVVVAELVRALRQPAAITSAPAATAVNTTR